MSLDREPFTVETQVIGPASVTGIIHALAEKGYRAQFVPEAGGTLRCSTCETPTRADAFCPERERRLEGASDPDDMVLNVASTCPVCGAKGSVVLGYGPEASEEDADVLAALPRGGTE